MKTKKLKLPHTLILIYIMVVLTAAATWIIPGGQYKRVEKDGRTIPVAGSYERAESRPGASSTPRPSSSSSSSAAARSP